MRRLYKSNLWNLIDILYQWYQPRFLYIDPEESEEEYRIGFHLIVHPQKQLEVLKGWKALFNSYIDVFTFHISDEVVTEVSSSGIPEELMKKVLELTIFNLKRLPVKDQREIEPKFQAIFTLPNVEARNSALITFFREVFIPLVPGELKVPSPSETENLYADVRFSSVLRFFSSVSLSAETDNYYNKQILISAKHILKTLPQGDDSYYLQNYDPKQRRERDLKRYFHKRKIVDKQKQREIRKRLGFD